MKEPREWNEEYVLNLPIGEFDWLEVKGRRGVDLSLPTVDENDVKLNLSKAISAFANSGGGTLVIGLSNPKKIWQVDDGGVDLSIKSPSTREWLEDVIPTLTDFPLKSFNVYVIQNDDEKSMIAPGRGVFVIEVQDSEQAPHQAIDGRYYVRVGGKSCPIGHRLVADIFGRRLHPKINLEFSVETSTYYERELVPTFRLPSPYGSAAEEKPKKRKCELHIAARNIGKILAQYVNCIVYIPKALIPELELEYEYKNNDDFEEIDGQKYVVWSKRNTRRDVIKAEVFGANQYGSSWFDPILPNLAFTWDQDISASFDKEKHGVLKIIWEAYADNAPPQKGEIRLKDIDVFVKSEDE